MSQESISIMALKRKKKIWMIAGGSLLAILIVLLVIANSVLSNMAGNILRENISSIDTTAYHVGFDKVKVNLFSRSVKVYGIRIEPTQRSLENVRLSRLAAPVARASIGLVHVGPVRILSLLRGRPPHIGEIRIVDPDITVYGPTGPFSGEREIPEGQTRSFYGSTGGNAPGEARLGALKVENARMRFIDHRKDRTVVETSGLYVMAYDLYIHHSADDSSTFLLDLEDGEINLQSHMMLLPGNLYTLSTGPLKASYGEGSLHVDSVRLIPEYSKEKFGDVVGKQTDRFDLFLENLALAGIAFDSLAEKKVLIDRVSINGPQADIYRDKRIPPDLKHFPKLFQTAVAALPFTLDIGQVEIANGNIKYEEIVEGAAVPGYILFDKSAVTISGISNRRVGGKKYGTILFDGSAMLMGKTAIKLNLSLPVGNAQEYFTFHGSVDPFTVGMLNPMIEPLAFILATEGHIKGVEFYGLARHDTAVGRMDFRYDGLKIEVLKKKKEADGIIVENKFLSFLAGALLHSDNPGSTGPERIGMMYAERDLNKGFFNFMWKTIESGLFNTMRPGKRHQANDMGWKEFKGGWEEVLQADRREATRGKSSPGRQK
jgi:hypothetical protein